MLHRGYISRTSTVSRSARLRRRAARAFVDRIFAASLPLSLRPRAAESLRETLRRMERYFGETNVAEITPEALTAWISEMPLALRSKKRHRGYGNQILEAARKKGYLAANPMKEVGTFKENGGGEEISILTPEETARLLLSAGAEMRPLYALAAFAGVRWGEIARLRWEDIRDREIVIRASTAKTRSRRVIEISENLKAFLQPTRGFCGPILSYPRSLERKRRRIEGEAGLVPWKNNALRHSFISYYFSLTHDENKTAAMAGNSPDIVHKHYRALVSKEEAIKYWNIRPE